MRKALAVIAVVGLAVVLYLGLRPSEPKTGPAQRGVASRHGGRQDVGDAAAGYADAAAWDAWYEKHRDRIVFIESTGFWWQEDPRILEREGKSEVPR